MGHLAQAGCRRRRALTASLIGVLWLALAGAAGPDAGIDTDDAGATAVPADAGSAAVGAADAAVPLVAPAPIAHTVVLAGRVVARGTREPLGAAQISFGPPAGLLQPGEADEDARFSLPVTAGKVHVQVQVPGYDILDTTLAVGAGGRSDVVLRLNPRTSGERYQTVVTASPERAPAVPLRGEELSRTAGTMGDPFRVVESLPGVTQVIWPLPMYAIRGANPGNTGYFIDGVRAPALFHFALGPSVIHPFFLEKMEFFPGGYPVDYGRYVSGIVTAKTAAPATDRLHASADVRLFDAGGIVAAPWDDGKGTVAVAGRYSYTGFLLSAFSNQYGLDYWDYQVRIDHRLGPGRLTLFAFGSGDSLVQKQPDAVNWDFAAGLAPQSGAANLTFHRVQLRWDGRVLGGRLLASVVGGLDNSTTSLTSLFALPVGSKMMTASPRVEMDWALARWLDMSLGADAEAQRFRPSSLASVLAPDLIDYYRTDLFRDRNALAGGAFVGFTLRGGSRLIVMPGLRYEGYFEEGERRWDPSPRLSVRVALTQDDWLKAAVGQFSQMASLPVGVPGFEGFGLKSFGLQRSRQGSLGLESNLEPRLGVDLSLDVTGFYQRLQLADLRNSLVPDPQARDLLELRQGESYGLEVMIRRPMRHRFYGWLAYTLSKSVRRVDGVIAPSDWDQRHVLNLVTGYRLPRGYSVSTRFHYNSGRPYPQYDKGTELVSYTRLPGFPQLDLRGDKRFVFDSFVMEIYLELVNSTMSREVFDSVRQEDGTVSEKAYRLVLPSMGVHVEW